jgi:hypothetical protein
VDLSDVNEVMQHLQDAICWRKGVFADLPLHDTDKLMPEYAAATGLDPDAFRRSCFDHHYWDYTDRRNSMRVPRDLRILFGRFIGFVIPRMQRKPLAEIFVVRREAVENAFKTVFGPEGDGFELTLGKTMTQGYAIHRIAIHPRAQVLYQIYGRSRLGIVNFTVAFHRHDNSLILECLGRNLFLDMGDALVRSDADLITYFTREKVYVDDLERFFAQELA